MDSYVIRVYQRAPANPDALVGTIETACITGEQPFAGVPGELQSGGDG